MKKTRLKVWNIDFNKFAEILVICVTFVQLGSTNKLEDGEIIEDGTQIDPSIFNEEERQVFDFTMNAVSESCEGQ